MSALANVVINDRAATPVAHTFIPQGLVGTVATFVESTGSSVSDPKLTIKWTESQTGRRRVTLTLRKPIVQTQTINGVSTPLKVREGEIVVTANFDPTSTEQERADCVGLMANAMASTQTLINDTLVKNQGMF